MITYLVKEKNSCARCGVKHYWIEEEDTSLVFEHVCENGETIRKEISSREEARKLWSQITNIK